MESAIWPQRNKLQIIKVCSCAETSTMSSLISSFTGEQQEVSIMQLSQETDSTLYFKLYPQLELATVWIFWCSDLSCSPEGCVNIKFFSTKTALSKALATGLSRLLKKKKGTDLGRIVEKQYRNILYINQRTGLSSEAERFVVHELQTHMHINLWSSEDPLQI